MATELGTSDFHVREHVSTVSYAAMSVKYPPRWSDIQKVAAWCGGAVRLYEDAANRRARERFPRTECIPKGPKGRVHEEDIHGRWDEAQKAFVPAAEEVVS